MTAIYIGGAFALIALIWLIANREDLDGILVELEPLPSPAGAVLWGLVVFAVAVTWLFI